MTFIELSAVEWLIIGVVLAFVGLLIILDALLKDFEITIKKVAEKDVKKDIDIRI